MVYRDPASDEAQDELEESIDQVAAGASLAVGFVIADRIAAIGEGSTYAQAYAAMPDDLARIQYELDKGYNAVSKIITAGYTSMAANNDIWAQKYYKHANVQQVMFQDNAQIKTILDGGIEEAQLKARELFDTSVTAIVDSNKVVKPIKEAYKAIVNEQIANVAVGKAAYYKGVAEAVKTLSNSGLRVVYASGLTRDLYSAVAMNVMGGYRTTMTEMRIKQGDEFGANGYEVSAHVPCAEDHEPYQGRQFSKQVFQSINQGLSRELVYGPNCKHTVSPVILGVSPPAYSKEKLQSMTKANNRTVSFQGQSWTDQYGNLHQGKELSMNLYDASQYQRKMETSIRKMNTERALLERVGESVPSSLKTDIARTTAEYKAISSKIGLTTRMERTKAYVLN